MEFRFHHILLSAALVAVASSAHSADKLTLNNEYFEIGVNTGVINIQDFNAEMTLGLQASFTASEDFFLQFNYLTAQASNSSYENQTSPYFTGEHRNFNHYDLLLGYNLFQGEVLYSENYTGLSALYVVAGVGNVSFGEENEFSSTIGIGYKLGITRRINAHVDFRDYIYQTANTSQKDYTTHNTQLSLGIAYQW